MRFIDPAALCAIDGAAVAAFAESEECIVAVGGGDVRGAAATALLSSDYAVLTEDAAVHFDAPEVWRAVAMRAGRVALRLLVAGTTSATAREALAAGLCDEVITDEPQAWLERWMAKRSEAALDAAASLIRTASGDLRERQVFAKLFAEGEPQRGIRAFLARKGLHDRSAS